MNRKSFDEMLQRLRSIPEDRRTMAEIWGDMVTSGDILLGASLCTQCRGTGKTRDREGCAVPCEECSG
jgi:hypothetical protein